MIATLSHRKPDRVPIQLGCREEIMEGLRRHYGVQTNGEVAEILDADLCRTVTAATRFPRFAERLAQQPPERLGVSGSDRVIWHDEQTFEDHWGVAQRFGADGKYLQWISGPFVETDDIDGFPWPSDDDFQPPADLARQVAAYNRKGYWVTGSGPVHPFKQAWHMRGFENFLCDYVLNPAWVERIYRRLVEFNLRSCRALETDRRNPPGRLARAGPSMSMGAPVNGSWEGGYLCWASRWALCARRLERFRSSRRFSPFV